MSNTSSSPLPTVLGAYRVVRKIGEGGMGAVYLAEDTKLGRLAAVKTMKPALAADRDARDRFEREARAAAAVEHDNIVPVWGVGEADDGTPFIAMPFLQGEMLDARLKREPVAGLGRLLKVAREVADGLAAAHAKGLIHRDIKPGNIWLEGDPTSPDLNQQMRRCKILDFGLARSTEPTDSQITVSGAVLGTPAYMSPEQAKGESLDPRSDLFSLGVMLFRMATGQLPFQGPHAMAVLYELTHKQLPPLKTLAPQLPSAVAALVDRLLAKNPGDRPQSAAEVSAEVKRIVKGLQAKKSAGEVSSTATAVTQGAAPAEVEVSVSLVQPPTAEDTDTAVERTVRPPKAKSRARRPKPKPFPWALAGGIATGVLVLAVGVWLVAKPRANKGEPDVATKPNDKPAVQTPPPVVPTTPVDTPDRKAAEYVLSVGGKVRVSSVPRDLADKKDLPATPFTLLTIGLDNNARVTDEGLAVLRGCTGLHAVELRNTSLGNAGLAHVASGKQIRYVNIDGAKVTDEGMVVLNDCAQLTGLTLVRSDIGAAGLAGAKNWPVLHEIWLDSSSLIDDAALKHLHNCTQLKYVKARGTKVTGPGVAALSKALPGCEIEWDGGTVRPAAYNATAERKAAEWVLNIGGTVQVDNLSGSIRQVGDLPPSDFRLTHVYLTSNGRVTNEGLAVFKECTQLRSLMLSGTKVTAVGLANFQNCAELGWLDLKNVKAGDAGLAHFRNCKMLWHLELNGADIGDTGLAHLKELPALVTAMLVDNSRVTDAGLEAFKGSKSLQYLFVEGTQVTDDGLLQNLKSCPKLIMLRYTTRLKAPSAAINSLQKELPKCKITPVAPTAKK